MYEIPSNAIIYLLSIVDGFSVVGISKMSIKNPLTLGARGLVFGAIYSMTGLRVGDTELVSVVERCMDSRESKKAGTSLERRVFQSPPVGSEILSRIFLAYVKIWRIRPISCTFSGNGISALSLNCGPGVNTSFGLVEEKRI